MKKNNNREKKKMKRIKQRFMWFDLKPTFTGENEELLPWF